MYVCECLATIYVGFTYGACTDVYLETTKSFREFHFKIQSFHKILVMLVLVKLIISK